MCHLKRTFKKEHFIKNFTFSYHKLLLTPLIILLTLVSCSHPVQEQEQQKVLPLTTSIDNLIERIHEGEEIDQVDRNKIYDLAHYLNNKYKGGMDSDEIIEVVD